VYDEAERVDAEVQWQNEQTREQNRQNEQTREQIYQRLLKQVHNDVEAALEAKMYPKGYFNKKGEHVVTVSRLQLVLNHFVDHLNIFNDKLLKETTTVGKNGKTKGSAVTITQRRNDPRRLFFKVKLRKLADEQIPSDKQAWTEVFVIHNFEGANSIPSPHNYGEYQVHTQPQLEFSLKLNGNDYGVTAGAPLTVGVNVIVGKSRHDPGATIITLGEVAIPHSKLRLLREPDEKTLLKLHIERMKDMMNEKIIPRELLAYAGKKLQADEDARVSRDQLDAE
jgi:hypothetical protein